MEHGSVKHHGTALRNPTAWPRRKRQQPPATSVCVCVFVCVCVIQPVIDDCPGMREHFPAMIKFLMQFCLCCGF